MTDENVDQNWGDEEQGSAPEVQYPEYPQDPHNHRFTISLDGRGPMIVARGNTAKEINEAFQELTDAETGPILAAFWSQLKAGMTVGQNLGPVTHVPQGQAPQAPAPQGATPPPFGPNVSVPQAPGYQGPPQGGAPAPMGGGGGGWQGQPQGGQTNSRGPKPRPDWPSVYKINVPFNQKDAFGKYRNDNKDYFKGKVFWAGGGDYWIHGDVAQAFANFNPVAA